MTKTKRNSNAIPASNKKGSTEADPKGAKKSEKTTERKRKSLVISVKDNEGQDDSKNEFGINF